MAEDSTRTPESGTPITPKTVLAAAIEQPTHAEPPTDPYPGDIGLTPEVMADLQGGEPDKVELEAPDPAVTDAGAASILSDRKAREHVLSGILANLNRVWPADRQPHVGDVGHVTMSSGMWWHLRQMVEEELARLNEPTPAVPPKEGYVVSRSLLRAMDKWLETLRGSPHSDAYQALEMLTAIRKMAGDHPMLQPPHAHNPDPRGVTLEYSSTDGALLNAHSPEASAMRTLRGLGYTHEGGVEWRPPLGPAPVFAEDIKPIIGTIASACASWPAHAFRAVTLKVDDWGTVMRALKGKVIREPATDPSYLNALAIVGEEIAKPEAAARIWWLNCLSSAIGHSMKQSEGLPWEARTLAAAKEVLRDVLGTDVDSDRFTRLPVSHPQALSLPLAIDTLKAHLKGDDELAWTWHCNIAAPISQSLFYSHWDANREAARLMRHLFDVDMEAHPLYIELMEAADPAPTAEECDTPTVVHMKTLRPAIAYPARAVSFTLTHDSVGDDLFYPMVAAALRELAEHEEKVESHGYAFAVIDGRADPARWPFTASNGVRVDCEPWKTMDPDEMPEELASVTISGAPETVAQFVGEHIGKDAAPAGDVLTVGIDTGTDIGTQWVAVMHPGGGAAAGECAAFTVTPGTGLIGASGGVGMAATLATAPDETSDEAIDLTAAGIDWGSIAKGAEADATMADVAGISGAALTMRIDGDGKVAGIGTRPAPVHIEPTIGRRLWVRRNPEITREVDQHEGITMLDREQALDAGIVYVEPAREGDVWRRIRVAGFDHDGHAFSLSLPLRQDGDPEPRTRYWAEWMPFQKGQAKAGKA